MHPSHNGLVTRKSFPCHDVIISWVFFKVVITDLSEEDGVAAEIEFKAVYGEDHILFVKGDVTKQEDMEGMYIPICREGTAYITVTLQERHGISSHRQLNYFFNNLRHFRAMTSSRRACLHHTPWSFHSCYNTLDILRHYFSKNNSVKTHHSLPVTLWRHEMEKFPRYWPFVRGIHRSPVNSPHKGQWRGPLMFSLICVWINGWINNRKAGDLRRHPVHYDVIVMKGELWGVLWVHSLNKVIAFFLSYRFQYRVIFNRGIWRVYNIELWLWGEC